MSGRFTRKMYDTCAFHQDTQQSTGTLGLTMDVTKYVHNENICGNNNAYPTTSQFLVDVESSLWGIDKLSSNCDMSQQPYCSPMGCLMAKDTNVPQHVTPYLAERGKMGDNSVVTTNMRMPQYPGYRVPNVNICDPQNNQNKQSYNNNQVNNSQINTSNQKHFY